MDSPSPPPSPSPSPSPTLSLSLQASGNWGNYHLLLLASAVKRHGATDWSLVFQELNSCARKNGLPLASSPEACKQRFDAWRGQYASSSSGSRDQEICDIMLAELTRQRVAHLKRELEIYDGNIGSLQKKIRRLKAERDYSVADSRLPGKSVATKIDEDVPKVPSAKAEPDSRLIIDDGCKNDCEEEEKLLPMCGSDVVFISKVGEDTSPELPRSQNDDTIGGNSQDDGVKCISGDGPLGEDILDNVGDSGIVTGVGMLDEGDDGSKCNSEEDNRCLHDVHPDLVDADPPRQLEGSYLLCDGDDQLVSHGPLSTSIEGPIQVDASHDALVAPCSDESQKTLKPEVNATSNASASDQCLSVTAVTTETLEMEPRVESDAVGTSHSSSPEDGRSGACAVHVGAAECDTQKACPSEKQEEVMECARSDVQDSSTEVQSLDETSDVQATFPLGRPSAKCGGAGESNTSITSLITGVGFDGKCEEATGLETSDMHIDMGLSGKMAVEGTLTCLSLNTIQSTSPASPCLGMEAETKEVASVSDSIGDSLAPHVASSTPDGQVQERTGMKSVGETCSEELLSLEVLETCGRLDGQDDFNMGLGSLGIKPLESGELNVQEACADVSSTPIACHKTQQMEEFAANEAQVDGNEDKDGGYDSDVVAKTQGQQSLAKAECESGSTDASDSQDRLRNKAEVSLRQTSCSNFYTMQDDAAVCASHEGSGIAYDPGKDSDVLEIQGSRDFGDSQMEKSEAGSPLDGVDDASPSSRKNRREPKVPGKLLPLLDCLRAICVHKFAPLFKQKQENQESVHYHHLIKRHMDLSMIRTRLEEGAYSGSLEFFRDLLLIFNNALVYYHKDAPEYLAAQVLRDAATQEMHRIFQTEALLKQDGPSTRNREPKKALAVTPNLSSDGRRRGSARLPLMDNPSTDSTLDFEDVSKSASLSAVGPSSSSRGDEPANTEDEEEVEGRSKDVKRGRSANRGRMKDHVEADQKKAPKTFARVRPRVVNEEVLFAGKATTRGTLEEDQTVPDEGKRAPKLVAKGTVKEQEQNVKSSGKGTTEMKTSKGTGSRQLGTPLVSSQGKGRPSRGLKRATPVPQLQKESKRPPSQSKKRVRRQ